MSNNPNLDVVRRKAREYGAIILRISEGARHTHVILLTREGRQVRMALSRTRIDPFILQGWTRQAITQPPRDIFAEVARNVANDNEEIPLKRG